MKISELSRASGIPVASIKFYLREGLLPAGERIGPNQATYSDRHVRRLTAIRALRDIAGLSVLTIKRLVDAIEDPDLPLFELLGAVSAALVEPVGVRNDNAEAEREVGELLAAVGWQVEPGSVRRRLAETLTAIRASFPVPVPWQALIPYAKAVEGIAQAEIAYSIQAMESDRDRAVETVVVGTILFERVLAALRRAAHEHFTLVALGLEVDQSLPGSERRSFEPGPVVR